MSAGGEREMSAGGGRTQSSGESAATPTILAEILQSTRIEVQERRRAQPQQTLQARPGGGAPHRLIEALSRPGIGAIAEIKRRSPSAGAIRTEVDVPALAAAYERAGASAISVLTEGPHFGGSLQDLEAVRAACELPILRKDFVVDPYQLHEAVAAGADAVLLIVAALDASELSELRDQAQELGLDALVEVHDERELEVALSIGAQLIGINNRDLRDFSVDTRRTFALLPGMPQDVTIVSESGISSAGQLEQLQAAGVDAVLIGETLMRAEDPGAALACLLGGEAASPPCPGPSRSPLPPTFRIADEKL